MGTDSRVIAKHFGKAHRDILASIKGLKCTRGFWSENFQLDSFADDKGRVFPMYKMTRDGYAMLTLVLNNRPSTDWKEHLVVSFNLEPLDWHKVEVRI